MVLTGSVIVSGFALFLVAMGGLSMFKPDAVRRFLGTFAQSPRNHFIEQGLRLLAGIALIVAAPAMRYSSANLIFGWVLVATALALIVLPWQWHKKFAGWAVPFAQRNLLLYAGGSLVLGLFLLFSVASVFQGK